MNAENQASENEDNEVAISDPDMEDFVNVSDAASRVLSVLRDVRSSRHSSARRLSLELSNSFAGVAGRRRARRASPVSTRRGRGRRASLWRTHIVCLAQKDTMRTVTRSELERLTRAGFGVPRHEISLIPGDQLYSELPLNWTAEQMDRWVLQTFPLLDRCSYTYLKSDNNRNLVPLPAEASTPEMLRREVRQGKLYIRPTANLLSSSVETLSTPARAEEGDHPRRTSRVYN
jgi:hypothetical protein